ncbi:MAG: hypothetical protein WD847_06045 [Pirellulales bacterium]
MDAVCSIPRVQFSLRMLFVATTTCAVAFAVMARSHLDTVRVLAGCVPSFWLGLGCLVAADALPLKERAAFGCLAATMVGLGMVILCTSVIIALHLLPAAALELLLG